MNITNLRIADLTPDPENARQHDEKNLKAIQGSLKEFGQRKPIVITQANVIVAGNGTVLAAKNLGWETIEAVQVPADWSKDQVKAFALADNRTAELATWSPEVLAAQLIELESAGFEIAEFGFDKVGSPIDPDSLGEDKIPEPPVNATTKLGDVWQLGNHRLMCSDATNQKSIELLMDGNTADLVFTDPPYGMGLDTTYKMGNDEMRKEKGVSKSKGYQKVIGDNEDFKDELITTIFENFRHCSEIFIWGADYYPDLLEDYKKGNFIVWDKRRNDGMEEKGQFGGFKTSEFEICWSKKKHQKEIVRILWAGLFGTEQEFDHRRVHPTQKPTKLAAWFLNKYSKENEKIVDVYGGSGSTLIACEQTNRSCYMMELDPKYCDVIIERWEKLTGLKAELVNATR
jgi:DNA modification methylase